MLWLIDNIASVVTCLTGVDMGMVGWTFAPSDDVATGGGKFVRCLFAPADDASAGGRGGGDATWVRLRTSMGRGSIMRRKGCGDIICVHSSPSTRQRQFFRVRHSSGLLFIIARQLPSVVDFILVLASGCHGS